MSDQLNFYAEASPGLRTGDAPWILLIADDEREVHAVTKLALSGFRFAGREIEFLHAYSGRETRSLLAQHPDIALVLLDVVMETEHAGLDVVEYVRNKLKNRFVRIILRTGQPGQAPELDVITRYDINDYKYKTELTRERLFTTVYTSLSVHRDLVALDANRRGLEKVIDASAQIFEMHSLEQFAQGVLEQLAALLFQESDALVLHTAGVATQGQAEAMSIVAGIGCFESLVGRDGWQALQPRIRDRIQSARGQPGAHYRPDYFIGVQPGAGKGELIFYIDADRTINQPDSRLIEKFCKNVSIAYRNLHKLKSTRRRPRQDRAG